MGSNHRQAGLEPTALPLSYLPTYPLPLNRWARSRTVIAGRQTVTEASLPEMG